MTQRVDSTADRGYAEREEHPQRPTQGLLPRQESLGHQAPSRRGQPGAASRSGSDHGRRGGPQGHLQALDRCKSGLCRVKAVMADGSYMGKPFAKSVRDMPGETVQIATRSELHKFAVIPRRTQLCVAGDVSQAVEKLRTQAQHQLAVRPSGFPHIAFQEIVNRC